MKNTNIITTTNTNTTNSKGVNNMKKTNTIKARIIAGILSAIIVFSVGSIAMTSASAAVFSDEFTGAMKSAGIETADAAFETVADLIPGGKIVLAPFKSLFHTAVDGEDPQAGIESKLDKVDGKLDQLDSRLTDLNNNINKNTQFMAEKIENTADMSELRSEFKGLSPQVAKLVKDVKAAETQPNTNKTQKIMRLAAITDTNRYDKVTTYVYNIQKSMDGVDPAYVDMYKALYTKSALNKMFAREAYNEARPTAEALTAQYVYAVALMQECQTAVKAVAGFNAEDIKALGTGYERNAYNSFNIHRHQMDDNDPANALISAAIGAKNFKNKYDRVAFINKSAKTDGKEVTFGQADGYSYKFDIDRMNYLDVECKVKNKALTTKELTAIADYVRESFNGKSLYEFLTKNLGVKADFAKNSYMIVADKISVSKTRNESLDRSFYGHGYDFSGYDRKGTIKAIRLDDTNVKVTDITTFTYESFDDDFCSFVFDIQYDKVEQNAYGYYIKMLRVFNA